MRNKLTTSLLVFLLLIPFRLPISILFIYFFKWIIGISTQEVIPNGILATNVITSKMVYNIALSSIFLYSIESFSREKYSRKAKSTSYGTTSEELFYWWTVAIGILLIVFIIIDCISINDIFFLSK